MTKQFHHQSSLQPDTRISFEPVHKWNPAYRARLQQLLKRIGYCLFVLVNFLIYTHSFAQSYGGLNQLKGYQTAAYFSSGAEDKAKRMAKQLDRVMAFYAEQIRFTPSVTLLVLSPADWNKYTQFPVYGMPHYSGNKTLIVASEDNDYWKSFIPPVDKLPKEYAQLITSTYAGKKGGLTMEPFFDLLAIHELGHAYHLQDSLVMQRKWMGELFSNMLLHCYIAENEPALLPALTAFPEMVVATTDRSALKYTTLEDLETYYNTIGPEYPKNYGWYQCRWHMAAGKIYDAGGLEAFRKLWFMLKEQREILDDESFAALLGRQVQQSVADVQLKWDDNN